MKHIIVNDLLIKRQMNIILFCLFWVISLIITIFFIYMPKNVYDILIFILLFFIPIIIYFYKLLSLRKIEFDDISRNILIYNFYKIIKIINLKNISKIKYYSGEENIADYGNSYYDSIEIYDIKNEKMLNYKSNEINIIYYEMVKSDEKILIEYNIENIPS